MRFSDSFAAGLRFSGIGSALTAPATTRSSQRLPSLAACIAASGLLFGRRVGRRRLEHAGVAVQIALDLGVGPGRARADEQNRGRNCLDEVEMHVFLPVLN